jgi:hypothetical protein
MVHGEQDTVMSCICALYDELDIVKVIKIGRLKWLGQLLRIQELDPCRKLTVLKPEDTRRVEKPKLKWLELVEGELKNFLSNWRRKLQDREQWRTVLEEATIRQKLERQKKKKKKKKKKRKRKRKKKKYL